MNDSIREHERVGVAPIIKIWLNLDFGNLGVCGRDLQIPQYEEQIRWMTHQLLEAEEGQEKL